MWNICTGGGQQGRDHSALRGTHHAVVLHVGVEADGPVRAVEVEGDVGEVCPALLLRVSSAGTAAAAAAAGRGAEVLIIIMWEPATSSNVNLGTNGRGSDSKLFLIVTLDFDWIWPLATSLPRPALLAGRRASCQGRQKKFCTMESTFSALLVV